MRLYFNNCPTTRLSFKDSESEDVSSVVGILLSISESLKELVLLSLNCVFCANGLGLGKLSGNDISDSEVSEVSDVIFFGKVNIFEDVSDSISSGKDIKG